MHNTPPRLSLLDLVAVREGGTVGQALHIALQTARHAEQLGFVRYWLAEHHNMPGIASSATAVLVGHIAGGTEHIRVGSGGIMLPNHAPLVVAEAFGTLAELYPGRIDLGLGRAPGTDQATMRALRRNKVEQEDDFPRDVAELQALLAPCNRGKGWSPCRALARRYPSGCWAPACTRHSWRPEKACPMHLHRTLRHATCTRRLRCTAACSSPPPHCPNLM